MSDAGAHRNGEIHSMQRRPHPAAYCICNHTQEEHNLAGDNVTRKRCDTGTAQGPCGCQRFSLAFFRYVVTGYEDVIPA